MVNILFPAEFTADFVARLKSLGFSARSFAEGAVNDLTGATAEVVYLLPQQAMDAKGWPRLRVKLAEACRLYIVCIGKVSTAAVARVLLDGAHDVLSNEDDDARWREAIMKAAANQKVWLQLYGGRPASADDEIIGRSESIQRLRQTIERLGPTDVGVLVQGESGVGKELVAAALHKAGHGKTFVALNCAAIPKDLLEAELFGVEKGAFTGALKARPGLVEQAHGGTLFLDEVGEMELGVQPKLLRFLETRRARRVGGEQEYTVTVRVISATNRNLDAEVADKRVRADLFYRLQEIILHAPPLRTRPEDIPLLALAFMQKANARFGKNFITLEPALIEKFQRYSWPGNVREFKGAVDRLVLLFDGTILRESWWDIPQRMAAELSAPGPTAAPAPPPAPAPGPAAQPTPEADRIPGSTASGVAPAAEAAAAAQSAAAPGAVTPGLGIPNQKQKLVLARKLLQESGDNYSWVASQLGINTSTLWRWRKTGKLG